MTREKTSFTGQFFGVIYERSKHKSLFMVSQWGELLFKTHFFQLSYDDILPSVPFGWKSDWGGGGGGEQLSL